MNKTSEPDDPKAAETEYAQCNRTKRSEVQNEIAKVVAFL